MFYFIFKGKQKFLNYFHLNAYKKQQKKITTYILIFIMCVQVEGFYFFLKNSFKSSKKYPEWRVGAQQSWQTFITHKFFFSK